MKSSISKNISWNIIGYLIPILVTIAVMPFTIDKLGAKEFGALSFIWMLVGYSSFLDMGIGRALTHFISSNLNTDNKKYIKSTSLTVLNYLAVFLFFIFILFVIIVYILLDYNIYFNNKNYLLYTIALLTALVAIYSSALRGVMEGFQKFNYINIVKLISGTLIAIAPLSVYSYSPYLIKIIIAFFIIRLVELLFYCLFSLKELNKEKSYGVLDKNKIIKILKYGGWSNLTNIVGSPMAAAYLDKFLITTFLGTVYLTYYTVPFDIMSRFLVLPAMITAVLFPILSQESNVEKKEGYVNNAIELITFVILPVFLITIIFSKNLLDVWLGDISDNMFILLKVFAIGKFAESLNFVYLIKIQAVGRPDLTAKRHLYELPFYIVIQCLMVKYYGVVGVAIVWCVWAIIDLFVLYLISQSLSNKKISLNAVKSFILVMLLFTTSLFISDVNFDIKLLMAFVFLSSYVFCFYKFVLNEDNKSYIKNKMKFLRF